MNVPIPQAQDCTKYVLHIRGLSFRQAHRMYAIGYDTWRAIKNGERNCWTPVHRNGDHQKTQDRRAVVLESVRTEPHFNTQERAKRLGISTRDAQAILTEARLGNLNARLSFAGYQVEVMQPLAVARQRRVVALRPGSLVHADFKTFGMVRGPLDQSKRYLRGCVIIDSFTSYAAVHLAEVACGAAAIVAFEKFMRDAPFELSGIVLTDNGSQFTSDEFLSWVLKHGLFHRTTRMNHPWSNGKVEALNKTLKYQCFPAICTGESLSLETIQELVDRWMSYYNTQRVHTGHMNRGLPPSVLYSLWHNTPGDHIEKIVKMGLISLDEVARLRYLGSPQRNAEEQRLRDVIAGAEVGIDSSQPLAFVIEGKGSSAFFPAETTSMGPSISHAFIPAK